MPKPGYVALNVRQEDARRLQAFANKNNLTVVRFVNMLATNLPEVDIQTLIHYLQNISKVKLHFTLHEEALKHHLASLYYYFQAMYDILSSLFPQPYIDLKILRIMKLWEDWVLPYTALCDAGIIDTSIDTFKLLRELDNAKEALKRTLSKYWSDWEKVKPPPLLTQFPVPRELLRPDIIVKPEARETLKNETKPYLEEIASICYETENILCKISAEFPDILELCETPLKNFKRLFKLNKNLPVN